MLNNSWWTALIYHNVILPLKPPVTWPPSLQQLSLGRVPDAALDTVQRHDIWMARQQNKVESNQGLWKMGSDSSSHFNWWGSNFFFSSNSQTNKNVGSFKKKWTPGCSKMFSLTNTITAWIIDSDVLEHPGAHHFDLFWCSSSLSNLASHRLPG